MIKIISFQANDSEVIHVMFSSVYEKISNALEGLPDEVLGISDEMKEQVCACSPTMQ